MTYNIKNSFGNFPTTSKNCQQWCCACDTNSLVDIAQNIIAEDPDIVALQEIGVRLRDAEYEDQLRTLSELSGLPHYYQLNTKDFEHQVDEAIWLDSHGPSGTNGVAILSRFPFVGHPESLRLERDFQTVAITGDVPGNLETMALRVTVDLPTASGTIRTDVYSVHLDKTDIHRTEQAHLIDAWARPDRPAILMGDLNTHDFHTNPSQLDTMLGWTDAWGSAVPSYPSDAPAKHIDHALVRNFSHAEAKDVFHSGGLESDHLPLVYDLELVGCPAFDVSSPSATFCDASSDCPACLVGEGGCSTDADCGVGLVCATGTGPSWGLPVGYNVCEVPPAAHGIPGIKTGLSLGTSGPASLYESSHEFRVSVASDDAFGIIMTYSTDQERQARVFVDGRPAARSVLLEDTGDWGGAGLWEEVWFQHIPLKAGDHVVTIDLGGDGVNLKKVEFRIANDGPWQHIPHPVAEGILEAEHFDEGGHVDQTPGNDGPGHRTDAPDVYIQDGREKVRLQTSVSVTESVAYTLDSPVARDLDLHIRYTAPIASTLHIELDGVDATGPIAMPATNGSGTLEWGDVTFQDLHFPVNNPSSGSLPMRVVLDAGQVAIDFFRFAPRWDAGPIAGEPWPLPSTIEAEYYDFEGYWDATAGNDGDVYRYDDDVDLWDDRTGHAPSGDFLVWGTDPGEWLEYTIDTGAAATIDLTLRYATNTANRTVSVLIDGSPVATGVALPSTGGWGQNNTWADHTLSGLAVTPGVRVLRIVFDNGNVNLDRLSVQ